MKAPSVREGSKENGTVAKIPLVSIAVRRWGTDFIQSLPLPRKSVPPSHSSFTPRRRKCGYADKFVAFLRSSLGMSLS